jgi:hypothetical protein
MPVPTCKRRAWLTLGPQSLALDTPSYACTSLDLGYPAPREVVNNRPDADGTDDRTALMGARVVQADLTAIATMGDESQTIDQIASSFSPYMLPSSRPQLHYVLDRPGAPERVLTLRPTAYAWPIVGAFQRDISLQWTAPDPIARDPATKTTTAWAGTIAGGGRTYPLYGPSGGLPRTYPVGSGSSTTGQVTTPGDVVVRPLLRVYGPITQARVNFAYYGGAGSASVPFKAGYAIAAGHYVEIDTAVHTAYLDGNSAQSVLSKLDWGALVWPAVPPLPGGAAVNLAGDPAGLVTSGVTQAQVIWQDGYLS